MGMLCGAITTSMVFHECFYVRHIFREVGHVLSKCVTHEIADIVKSDAPVECSSMESTFHKLDKAH